MSNPNVPTEQDASDVERVAREVLDRLRAAAGGDEQRELAWSTAVDGIGKTYLESRRLLGFMLERGWIVRHGRDRVSLTRRALERAPSSGSG